MSRKKEGGGGSKIITSTLQMGIALELHKPSHLGIKDWTGSSNQERERERERATSKATTRRRAWAPQELRPHSQVRMLRLIGMAPTSGQRHHL